MSKPITKTELFALREMYSEGTQVICLQCADEYHPIKRGTKGTVTHVDDIGTIHVEWENGSSLGIVYGVDKCQKID